MFSLSTIIKINKNAKSQSRKSKYEPYVFQPREIDCLPGGEFENKYSEFPFPIIGDYTPIGWEKVEDENGPIEYLVDATGCGSPKEPAWTWRQFNLILMDMYKQHPNYGYAITEMGQFQFYVAVFKRKGVPG